ncbi:S-adenosyl-methyltransferase mraW-like protein [Leishmania major strain Friedlin]|uniref:S-adenosyl-methyltransferase mraW-like protein n=1 Tax=Leishmania major TaxID=5664 RepID=Q4QB34_LEIMA|nr:S-adenosyl-methyltransferase mraW-like protein [Leishmania major strain Friedlin]CAG9574354.1 S-adenosyl-methyltransferase_mraW-like_protein [Leishmania major strain Friedlin]CAJ04793.1 S-adenosyl-methyltransferase mraW-like protein [Leishmania major strain Friedlin]|eukprot:XP_001683464.1 S-adenosyl-methyltransferase mraW-like protein [Leishmania major strain Friedlin]
MKRIVAPRRWSAINRVEHPPLMPKQLLQSVCGGLRWLESKSLAEFLAKRAIEEGFPCTKKQQRIFDARPPSSRPALRKSRLHKKCPARRSGGDVQRTEGSLEAPRTTGASGALVSSGAALALNSSAFDALVPLAKRKRLVSYDVLDCTFGSGFHTGVVLENGRPYTRVVAMDCDVEATVSAREIVDEFGADRFRFYARPMSEAKAMFGERSFDAVMIDPGPSSTQLENPERGFLLNDESDHALDMRYGPTHGLGALEYLNTVPQHALSGALASYELLTPQQSMKLARAIRQRRPFDGAQRVLEAVEEAGNELPEEGWGTQGSRRKTSMSWNFMTSLRCIVNHERHELSEALQNALLLLRTDGRLVVFSRLPWEEKLISTTISQHPHALLSYSEAIPIEDVQEHGHSRHTKMWIVTRTQGSSYVLKNSQTLTGEAVQESSMRWMSGLFAGQTFGFPANNFTFENKDGKDWAAVRRNKNSPPFDSDDDPRG